MFFARDATHVNSSSECLEKGINAFINFSRLKNEASFS